MDRSLLWGSFAVGIAGWLVTFLSPGSDRSAKPPGSIFPKLYWILAAALPPLIFLISLPSRPPFAEGQGLGWGFLIGGISTLLAALAVDRIAQHPAERSPTFAQAAPMFAAAAAASISLLFLWPNIIDTLLGIGIGWLSVTTVLIVGSLGRSAYGQKIPNTITSTSTKTDHPYTQTPTQPLIPGTAFAIALCATTALAVYKGQTAYDHHRWTALSSTIGASVPLLLMLTALPMALFGRIALKLPLAGYIAGLGARLFQSEDAGKAAAGLARVVIAGGLMLGLGKLLSVKLVDQPHIWHVLGVGLLISLVAWWLTSDSPKTQRPTPMNSSTPLLLTAAGFMAIFPLLTGFGIGLAVLAGWLIAAIASSANRENQTNDGRTSSIQLARLMTFGTLILLFRVFWTRFADDLHGVGLADQYALFGLIVGVALPSITTGILTNSGRGDVARLFKLTISAVLILAIPALMVLLWGPKCAVATLFGLAIAVGFGSDASRTNTSSTHPNTLPPIQIHTLFALASALALTQWLHFALPLASMTRAHKVQVVTWVVVGLVAMIVISDFIGKLKSPAPVSGDEDAQL